MTRWHTDKPVTPVRATPALTRIAPVSLFAATPVSRLALSSARAFYARKLRLWAKSRPPEAPQD